MTTLVDVWTAVRRRLEAAGVDTPVFDARLLLEAGAGVSRMDILTDPRRLLTPAQVAAVEALAQRRAAREPVAHILGRKQFWSLDLAVSGDVLIPRPETETLVQAALARIEDAAPARILDLGVGSGAILLSLLHERPSATGVGVDCSAAALAIAGDNADALKLSRRVTLVCGDWDTTFDAPFDFVVSNPPYIRSADIDTLAPEVARYEPRLALDGGTDGLDAYRAICARLPALLKLGAGFALEVGAGQAEDVAGLARAAGLVVDAVIPDLAGVQRVVAGWRRG